MRCVSLRGKSGGESTQCAHDAAKGKTRCQMCIDRRKRSSLKWNLLRAEKRASTRVPKDVISIEEYVKRRREYAREYYKSPKWRISARARKYGMRPDQVARLLDCVDNRCEICGAKSTRLAIDHSHFDGHVRGVLCPRCNGAISSLESHLFPSYCMYLLSAEGAPRGSCVISGVSDCKGPISKNSVRYIDMIRAAIDHLTGDKC